MLLCLFLSAKVEKKKSVQFSEDVQVKTLEKEEPVVTEISEEKIDKLLHLLHEADPTGERPDSPELISLEDQCSAMTPLIDQQLEQVDRYHVIYFDLVCTARVADHVCVFAGSMRA